MRDWRGEQLGAFLVEAPIGSGASATVWRGRHLSGQPVALKIARSDSADPFEEAVQLASLEHPGVVQVFAAGVLDGHGWLATELAAGTLRELQTPLSLGELARHLLRTLAHLHARGVVHRDVKPTNILVGCTPRTGLDAADRAGVRLGDFGIAWTGPGSAAPSAGTQGWAAPEQARGITHPSCDVYALAQVLRSLADTEALEQLGPWLARATQLDPVDRFPSAAHALAALPPLRSDVGRSLPEGSEETVTRPVLLSLMPVERTVEPCAVVEPVLPEQPPVPPERRPRADLLDVGLSLLPWRPLAEHGRSEVLLEAWRRLVQEQELVLTGAPLDVDEVRTTLEAWVGQCGGVRRIRTGSGGLAVLPLPEWRLQARAQVLGFDLPSARELARGCGDGTELRDRLLQYVRADLVRVGTEGLTVPLSVLVDEEQPEPTLEEAWWRGDLVACARGLARLRREPDTPRNQVLRDLHRAWSERRRGCEQARQLATDAASLDDPVLSARALVEAAGIAVRGRDAALAHELLDRAELLGVEDPRIEGRACLQRGFAYFMERSEQAVPHLQRAAVLADGRLRAVAFATLSDVALQQGRKEEALAHASTAVAALDPDDAEQSLQVRGALVVALVAVAADEALVTEQLDLLVEHSRWSTNRSVLARVALLRAQAAMRQEDWARADRLLGEAQGLYLRSGGSAVFVVLNHGLVGLKRGDLASIRAITPDNWARQEERAPPFLKPLVQLHELYARLGEADEARIEAALDGFPPGSLPEITREGIERAAELAPRWSERLRALLPD